MMKPRSKYFFCIVIAISLLSVFLKFQITDQAMPYTSVSDIQHVAVALDFVQEYSTSKKFPEIKQQTKYPLFLTYCYLITMNAMDVWAYPSNIELIRQVHILFFVLSLAIYFVFPIARSIQLGSCLLLALSFTAHYYSVIERIHGPAGAMVLLAMYFIMKFVLSEVFSLKWYLPAVVFSGLAASVFYTGLLVLCSLVITIFVYGRKMGINRMKQLMCATSAVVISFLIFSFFYPAIWGYIEGQNGLLMTKMFGHYFGEFGSGFESYSDVYDGSGALVILENIIAWDPLLWSGYVIGLYYLFRSGCWRSREWLPLLMVIVPYQLMMILISTSQARRSMFFIPIMAIISAFGLRKILNDYVKLKSIFSVALLFMLASMLRYNFLSVDHTQSQVFDYVATQLPENSNVLHSDRLPPFVLLRDSRFSSTPKNIEFVDVRKFRRVLKKDYQQNSSALINLVRQRNLGSNFHNNDVLNPVFMEAYPFDFLVINLNEADNDLKALSAVMQICEPLKEWKSKSSTTIMPRWPDDFNWVLWKIWRTEFAGPEIMIYRTPWSRF